MKALQPKRTKWLTIRMTEAEYTQLDTLARQTTTPTLSEYGRKVLLGKPVVKRYRNQSIDDYLTDMLQLQKELNQIGQHFNQSVHRLHSLRHLSDIQQWILLNEQDKTNLFRLIETISLKINEAYQLWSHE